MKLLVTTDFSVNSKGAIRFAQMLAKQSNEIEATFYHTVHFLKPTKWSDIFYKTFKQEEIERLTAELKKFVYSTIGEDKNKFANIKFVIDSAISTEKDIIRYAEKNKMDFICIATQGAGVLRKIMGTHTSYIVNNSKTPVLVIPSHYRAKVLKKVTYLSDFENLKKEIDKVSKFSGTVKCGLDVLHYSSIIFDKNKFERNKSLFSTEEYKNIKLNIVKNNLELSLVDRISQFISKSKPELLIMFTKREKSFFETIFLPSKSAELTYTTKIPVLIYSK
ncbi:MULTISPECIES: universal stress protein [Bacteroidota]|uniref:Universal stress protein n=1 Tax=Runella salmonicolor TaxID=2950278 RepID=A0ABT1FTT6_9BACT|nr:MULTISPECIES: universal stress protein [Bacteroidota]MBS4072362.1 universal stress protein [Algoriphagus sp.]MCP1385185.1 universal stress protein [Runella salmonicolor]RPD43425.1 universal stress protein [Paracnuella aquatica]